MRVKVPEGMAKAFHGAARHHVEDHKPTQCVLGADCSVNAGLEAVLVWQRDNLTLPKIKQLEALWNSLPTSLEPSPYWHKIRIVMGEWQRQMYVDTVPEEIEDLLLHDIKDGLFKPEILNEIIIQAFYRGQKAGLK
jgi:hypothetical protein